MCFYRRRRRSYGSSGKRISPWLIVAICAVATLLLTILIGNLLKLWLDDDTYRRLTDGKDTPKDEQPLYQSSVSPVHAYAYEVGDRLIDVLELPEVSFSLNTPDGKATYTSEVISYFAIPCLHDDPLDGSMSDLQTVATYISGVYHVQSFDTSDADLFYAETAVDCAILREFTEAGGNEILLCDIPYDTASAEDIATYLKTIKSAIGKCALGIALPLDVVGADGAWEVIGALTKVCDFLALDLRDSTVVLSDCNFYFSQYDMRLLVYETQEDYIASARENLSNFQTVTKFN